MHFQVLILCQSGQSQIQRSHSVFDQAYDQLFSVDEVFVRFLCVESRSRTPWLKIAPVFEDKVYNSSLF
jgi:hypothetical protein